MRIRIALSAAIVVALIISFSVAFSNVTVSAFTIKNATPVIAAAPVIFNKQNEPSIHGGRLLKNENTPPTQAGGAFSEQSYVQLTSPIANRKLNQNTTVSALGSANYPNVNVSLASVIAPVQAQTIATGSLAPPTDATSVNTADWQCIRIHESGDRYNSPAAPSGAYGILEITWLSNGYSGWPYEAPAGVQDQLALKLYNEFGWQPWSTRFMCGL